MTKNTTFHPRLIIVDHFDEIKNQIDVNTETLINQKYNDNILKNEKDINLLNELRQTQLNFVEKVQEKNLSLLVYDEIKYKQKWIPIIDDAILTIEEKLEIIKEELIINDCLLVEDNSFASGISIWITGWFFSKTNLEFLKYLFKSFF